jgi:hypothetical protein
MASCCEKGEEVSGFPKHAKCSLALYATISFSKKVRVSLYFTFLKISCETNKSV